MLNPASDLTAVQNILKADAEILQLLNLTGKPTLEILKRIIRKSKWDDLVSSERRLCIYFRPSRRTRNKKFFEEVLQIDCHVPSSDEFFAYRVLERVNDLLHEKQVNKRYLYFDGQLGELPTMSGFFCAGSRYIFNRNV